MILRKNIHSFKIHFDESRHFSKTEYLKVRKMHEMMKSSYKKRNTQSIYRIK